MQPPPPGSALTSQFKAQLRIEATGRRFKERLNGIQEVVGSDGLSGLAPNKSSKLLIRSVH